MQFVCLRSQLHENFFTETFDVVNTDDIHLPQLLSCFLRTINAGHLASLCCLSVPFLALFGVERTCRTASRAHFPHGFLPHSHLPVDSFLGIEGLKGGRGRRFFFTAARHFAQLMHIHCRLISKSTANHPFLVFRLLFRLLST